MSYQGQIKSDAGKAKAKADALMARAEEYSSFSGYSDDCSSQGAAPPVDWHQARDKAERAAMLYISSRQRDSNALNDIGISFAELDASAAERYFFRNRGGGRPVQ
jgi:hypothetical protein